MAERRTAYHVTDTPEGGIALVILEEYSDEADLTKTIGAKYTENRDRFLFGAASFLLSFGGMADSVSRVLPYVKQIENFKLDSNFIGPGVEFAASFALLAYATNSFSQVSRKTKEINDAESALSRCDHTETAAKDSS